MNWSVQILEKSSVDENAEITVKYAVLKDGFEVIQFTSKASTETIQQVISAKVTAYGASVELADSMLSVGEVLQIVQDAA